MPSTDLNLNDRVPAPEEIDGNSSSITPSVEKPEEFRPEEITYPEGGARGWAVSIGASVAILYERYNPANPSHYHITNYSCSATFGWVNSWGVFQEYYISHQLADQSPSAISWIGSLQIFFLFGGALFGGPLFDKYGERILWAASPIYLLSVFLTSVCKEYYQFMLAQGVLGGLGMGTLATFNPLFVQQDNVKQVFSTKKLRIYNGPLLYCNLALLQ